jgi:hypothetical protein
MTFSKSLVVIKILDSEGRKEDWERIQLRYRNILFEELEAFH